MKMYKIPKRSVRPISEGDGGVAAAAGPGGAAGVKGSLASVAIRLKTNTTKISPRFLWTMLKPFLMVSIMPIFASFLL